MLVRDILAAVDRLAPFALAEAWDHVGLQVGGLADEAQGVLVALEVDDATLDEAARLGCGLVLAHHPLIFSPLERLTDEDPAARVALRAARERIAVLVAHTNLDKAHGGLADVVAGMLGLEAVAPLAPAAADACKLVGFVPADDADLVRKALFAAGAGVIGDYEHCSWSVEGQGMFFGREGAVPTLGRAGRDETVDELRIEVVFPRRLRRRVLGAYVGAHPYEEPAYDVYPLENEVASLGLGRVGELPAAMPLAAFAAEVATALGLPSARYAGDPARPVKRVAVLPGSGAEAIARGVAAVADVLVTGDVKYHEARNAAAQGLALVDAPHGLTEEEAVLRWSERLRDALAASGVRVETYRAGAGVWRAGPAPSAASAAAQAASAPRPAAPAPPAEAAPAPTGESIPRPPAASHAAAAAPVHPAEAVPAPRPAAPPRPAGRDDEWHHLYTDGGARGNPGPAGIGARLLTAEGEVVAELAEAIGTATNNVAEYQALLSGLQMALDRGVRHLRVFMDSELVVKQVSGQYKVKDATLKTMHAEAVRLLSRFHEAKVGHVRREQNAAADALVNRALDAASR